MNTDSKILGYFSACFAIVIWGITFVCTKHLLLYFSALEILFIRFIQAYVFLFILYPNLYSASFRKNPHIFTDFAICNSSTTLRVC